MDKETTPQTYGAWKASIDDTGCVCRMEPIWETMERLEKENQQLQSKRCEKCNRVLPYDVSASIYCCTIGSGCAEYVVDELRDIANFLKR